MSAAPLDLEAVQARLRAFAAARDWEKFHTPKNLSAALSVEVAEIVELFQWLTPEESKALSSTPEGRTALEDEIADVMIYLARLADITGIDIGRAVDAKIIRNETRFPAPPENGS